MELRSTMMAAMAAGPILAAGCAHAGEGAAAGADPARAPLNILWIISDDHGPDLGCYGTPGVRSPRLDALAAEGVLFTRAHTTSPICSPSRSAFMTGSHQTTIGAHHHRSNRGDAAPGLPGDVRTVPDLFRDAGWFTANDDGAGNPGKTDLNFAHGVLFDGVSWSERADGQPFFAQVNLFQPHRPFVRAQNDPADPADVVLPPYLPDEPDLRLDRAQYHDSIRLLDVRVGQVLDRLEADGLADTTAVFFFGDNGRPFARDKQFLYNGGTNVPLIVRLPGGPSGEVRGDLVPIIDVAAESLALAGLEVPPWMQGRPFLDGSDPRDALFTARDRADETIDRIRAVRTRDFSYIRNYHPERPYLQQNAYKLKFYPDWRRLVELAEAVGDEGPEFPFLAATRPEEELYDLRADPWELSNLAGSPAHREVLLEMRARLDAWIEEAGDRGGEPEDPRVVREQIETMAEWLADGQSWGTWNASPWDD